MLKVKAGNVSDFPDIDQARQVVRQLVQTMIATKKRPGNIKRVPDLAELTVSEAFTPRPKPFEGAI